MDFINWELLNQFLSKKIISRIGERGEEWLSLLKLEYEYKKTLKKVFEKPLPLDKDLGVSLKEVYTDPKGVKDLISNQSLEPKGVSDLIWDRWENNQNSFILLLGQPGGGKSSLIKKLSYDWAENNREPYPKKVFERNLYTVQLRYLPKEFKDDPVKVLTNYLRGEYDQPHDPFLWDEEVIYLFKGYRNSILLLDGLDEFVMNYQLTEEETKNLLEKLADGLSRYNCKVLITSRPNYFSEEHLRELNKRLGYTVWELQPFTLEEINKFLDEYKRALTEKYDYQKKVNPKNPPKMHLENFDLLKDRVEENLNAEEPLVNQPLLLYMFAHLYLREGKTPQIGNDIELYEELINAVIQRVWENDNHLKKVITSAEWDYLYRKFLEELAFLIEFSNKPHATLEEIEKLKVFETLKGKTKLSEKTLLGSLLIFFYLHRDSDKEIQTVEFIHKTFQEYLGASNIYNRLLENLHMEDKKYEDLIWDLFSKKQISPKVREFLETIIENRREEDREKQDQFMERVKKLLPHLLEKKFLLKPSDGENTFNRALWCFGNFWIFTNKVAPIKDWDDETKQKFVCMVKYTQNCEETFIEVFPLKGTDLSGTDLSGADLSSADLRSADLSGADLSGTDLSGANLWDAYLRSAYLRSADLSDADLSDADLSGANLWDAYLRSAILRSADLSGADLSGADLSDARSWYADLSGADLSNADLSGADLSDANLWGADLSDAVLSDVTLRNAYLWDADLSGANLWDADLSDADLSDADLSDANLWGANLSGADLSDARLRKAVLRNANLSNTVLRNANLRGANLWNANLENANLEGADLRGAIFDPEEIKKAKNWDKAIYDDEMKKILGLE